MTYLELVQRAIRQSGARIDEPSTVSGASGLVELFADWVAMGWRDIQMERPEWFFRMVPQTIQISDSILTKGVQAPVSLIDSTNRQSWNHISLFDVFVQEWDSDAGDVDSSDAPSRVHFVPWNYWYDGSGRSEGQLDYNVTADEDGRPKRFTVAPTGELWFIPIPDKDYGIQFFGPKAIQTLSSDSDTPFIPDDYHDMIVWRAIRDYALYHQDAAMVEKARLRYNPLKQHLDYEYLPQVTLKPGAFYHEEY